MAIIKSIHVYVATMDVEDAGGDGPVYLGFCGREFSIDSSGDDFERDSHLTYIFGDGHNVSHPELNNPKEPQLRTEHADRFPVYIRLEHPTEHWMVQEVRVTINGADYPLWETADRIGGDGIWLGRNVGRVLYLSKHDDGLG